MAYITEVRNLAMSLNLWNVARGLINMNYYIKIDNITK